jgi:hypothetical protein
VELSIEAPSSVFSRSKRALPQDQSEVLTALRSQRLHNIFYAASAQPAKKRNINNVVRGVATAHPR